MESVIYTTFCLDALLTHCSLVSLDISTLAGWLFWNDTENGGEEPDRGPWRKSNQWGSSDGRSITGPVPSGCALSSGGRQKNLFVGWAGWWVVVGWSGAAILVGMSLKAGHWECGEARGKAGKPWDVSVCENTWRSFSGDKDNSVCPASAWGSKEQCRRMWCIISAPAPQQSFDYVHLGNPAFPYLHLSCPVVLKSKFGVSWNMPRTERSAMKPKIISSAASLRSSMIVPVRQLSIASSCCPGCWTRRRNFRDRIGGRVLKTCKDFITWCVGFLDTKQISLICSYFILTLCPIVFPPLKQSFKLRRGRKKIKQKELHFPGC